jgi:hypothetical protein
MRHWDTLGYTFWVSVWHYPQEESYGWDEYRKKGGDTRVYLCLGPFDRNLEMLANLGLRGARNSETNCTCLIDAMDWSITVIPCKRTCWDDTSTTASSTASTYRVCLVARVSYLTSCKLSPPMLTTYNWRVYLCYYIQLNFVAICLLSRLN